jgi:deazaflavin-dependent oxidoreductase (nitroreductase family)
VTNERQANNLRIIADFRAHGGVVGGMFEGVPILLLHHIGAKSGNAYISPLAYLPDGERWVIFAGNGGRPENPSWYFNLLAVPTAAVEVGTEAHKVTARLVDGPQREEYIERQKQITPGIGEMEKKSGRDVPVFVLERARD